MTRVKVTVESTPTSTMRNYTRKEIAHLLNTSTRTIGDYETYLNITPSKGDRDCNLYTETDFDLISQLRSHLADKSKTKESFVPTISPTLVEESVGFLAKHNPQDPLFDLDSELMRLVKLQEISDRKWLLPTELIAALLDISNNTLVKYQTYCYCGFTVSRETRNINKLTSGKITRGNKLLWKIERTVTYGGKPAVVSTDLSNT